MARDATNRRFIIIPPHWIAAAQQLGQRMGGLFLLALGVALALAFASHDPLDPSMNRATLRTAENWLGWMGSYSSDFAYQLAGLGALLWVPVLIVMGLRILRGRDITHWRRYLLATTGAVFAAGAAWGLSTLDLPSLPAGAGGLIGLSADALEQSMTYALPHVGTLALTRVCAAALLSAIALGLWLWGLGIDYTSWQKLFARVEAAADRRLHPAPAPVSKPRRPRVRVAPEEDGDAEDEASGEEDIPAPRVNIAVTAPRPSKRPARERQATLDLRDAYKLPTLSLLKPAPKEKTQKVDSAALELNARLLESVLEDFGVKGRIVEVRPGPVVTMYELEPAAGIKASRVIGLADDIARSMSAISARVAVVPGRNVIGIELPNVRREMVSLTELLGSAAFEDQNAALPLVLGKNIAGDPVIADLAPMPHLLIAGTTGSGKSVGLNAMILSLLYRLTPTHCRLIMIDPKMLELSVYDGIPHLLSPVVTEPAKAIRALKWAVEQMEDRYRMMASINVRSLSGFNQRVREAKAANKPFVRKVHTGYDPESGQPVYESENLEFEPLPLIVVVVDELADLMMTAGKEVEYLIQRLAQKARAAGIHLIMATQRPSVDVITGVIKANLPTRISFQVTSKIDSRTILGEQGAEQLLGKGDMLYMPGGKQIARVHGPFVSDEEVEAVADHWRGQGQPDYVQAVTEEPEGGEQLGLGLDISADDGEGQLYRRAIQIVAESQKASTSYIQRQLRIGYNSAARLIERMEKDGLVGAADHVGRREVLIDTDGNRV